MTEPFKNVFNLNLIKNMATHFSLHDAKFQQKKFIEQASKQLDTLELKERSDQIRLAMVKYLPEQLYDAAPILFASLAPLTQENIGDDDIIIKEMDDGIAGWAIMPTADFIGKKFYHDKNNSSIATHDVNDIPLAMSLLKEVTKRFSAEFGIRYLLVTYPEQTLAILKTWLTDHNKHVRRLVSEGTRPKLPWGIHLPYFIQQPDLVIELLEQLKDDPEEYVRRSVANNLNDIAKDHPNLVANIAEQWLKDADKNRARLVRHACRTLIKNGNQQVLKALGYTTSNIKDVELTLNTETLQFGESIQLSLALTSTSDIEQSLMIDYIVHHQKANGKTSPKTFKWKTCQLPASKTLTMQKKHAIKKITTRVYYPGKHTVEVLINGKVFTSQSFELLIADKQ